MRFPTPMVPTLLVPALFLVACGPDEPPVDSATPEPIAVNVRMSNTSTAPLQTSTGADYEVMFAPGILIVHDDSFALYEPGMPILFPGLEALAEDGNNAPLIAQLEGLPGVWKVESYAALDEDYNSAPMLPGDSAILSELAEPGARLTVAAMYGESNDVFAATPPEGVPLWNEDGTAAVGSLTDTLAFWDAGTEVNEEPGMGANQPMRQLAPDTGPDENGVVVQVDLVDASNFDYPSPQSVLAVDVEAAPTE